MATPTLIYCASGNRLFAQLAIDAGFKYGSQFPGTTYFPVYFADQNWKKPDRELYMQALSIHRPHIASVLDWEKLDQLPEVLSWAEEAAQFCEVILIVPKVHNSIHKLPRFIGGKSVRLGYSVPTSFGGTDLMLSEFYNWPVHLLGGSPHKQLEISHYLPSVVSADGNMVSKMATRYCAFFDPFYPRHRRGYWPTLKDLNLQISREENGPAKAIELSFANIQKMWSNF